MMGERQLRSSGIQAVRINAAVARRGYLQRWKLITAAIQVAAGRRELLDVLRQPFYLG